MTDYTLHIPEDIYRRAEHIAKEGGQTIDKVLIDHLQTLALSTLPLDEQKELEALKFLSDDALRTIAREQLPSDVQSRMQTLMDRNTQGSITSTEYDELASHVDRGNRLMVRKAEAAYLLQSRGHSFKQDDFKTSHE
jgi:hypothetical protein